VALPSKQLKFIYCPLISFPDAPYTAEVKFIALFINFRNTYEQEPEDKEYIKRSLCVLTHHHIATWKNNIQGHTKH